MSLPTVRKCLLLSNEFFLLLQTLLTAAAHWAGLVCKKLATCSPDAAVDLEIFRYKKKYFVMTRDSWPRSSSRTQRGDKWRLWRENVTHSSRAAAAWEPGHRGQSGQIDTRAVNGPKVAQCPEKAPTRAFLVESAFTMKNLWIVRHYTKWMFKHSK